jgi:hypothetical protein
MQNILARFDVFDVANLFMPIGMIALILRGSRAIRLTSEPGDAPREFFSAR